MLSCVKFVCRGRSPSAQEYQYLMLTELSLHVLCTAPPRPSTLCQVGYVSVKQVVVCHCMDGLLSSCLRAQQKGDESNVGIPGIPIR